MRFAIAMVLLQLMSWVPSAHAASRADGAKAEADKDAARSEWRQGNVAYDLGHYDEAAKHYDSAYTLVQDPAFLFNIAQSYRMADKLDQALDRYRAFLRKASADAPNRNTAEKFTAEIKRKLEEKKESAPVAPPEVVPVNKPVAAPQPTPAEMPTAGPSSATSPPPALLAVPIPPPVETNLVSVPAPAEQTSIDQPIYKKWWFWTGVGVVVAAGIVTAILLTRPSNNPCRRDEPALRGGPVAMRRVLWTLSLLAGVASCSSKQNDTKIVVEVWSDLAVPGQMDEIRIAAKGTTASKPFVFPLTDKTSLPAVLVLVPPDNQDLPFDVTATGYLKSNPVVSQAAHLSFVSGKSLVLTLFLGSACTVVPCPTNQTCSGGNCQPVDVDVNGLPAYDPNAPMLPPDAGVGARRDGSAYVGDVAARRCEADGVDAGRNGQETGDSAADKPVDVPVSAPDSGANMLDGGRRHWRWWEQRERGS